ncbi:HIT domain-containing protein [Mesorhizobium sp. NBSH29]|uniref:HIT family protein n=1 Tax=Mesorhizobium sp. NBSH29 TaxID=2654249 RepID=UPI0018965C42|nr:HIT family protein [Mesorhizobium sp. NBSH29]QPC87676.1 HIT domain-containing protein [Mesorhizobium sp. NBSH29]
MTAPLYDPQNIFAKILRGEIPSHKIFEDADTLAIMDVMPQGEGHCLVLPKAPARNLLDASPESLSAVMATAQKLARAVKSAFAADGVTVMQFNEAAGGQSMFHLHVHVIPRFEGIALKPHTGSMEKPEILATNAEKIRAALASLG